MHFEETRIPGLVVIVPRRFSDDRGFFSESWSRRSFAEHGLTMDFVQDNHSLSKEIGTVRGLHFQAPPHAQGKLVRCGRGALFDVAVDIRKGSPTFGEWFGIELSFENGKQLYIPEGFLHGFATRERDTEIVYKCTDFYSAEADGAVRFDDADLAIDWGVDINQAILSPKDSAAPTFAKFDSPFVFER